MKDISVNLKTAEHKKILDREKSTISFEARILQTSNCHENNLGLRFLCFETD
jgi:hypothetical protein